MSMKNSEHTCAARFEELVIVTLFALEVDRLGFSDRCCGGGGYLLLPSAAPLD